MKNNTRIFLSANLTLPSLCINYPSTSARCLEGKKQKFEGKASRHQGIRLTQCVRNMCRRASPKWHHFFHLGTVDKDFLALLVTLQMNGRTSCLRRTSGLKIAIQLNISRSEDRDKTNYSIAMDGNELLSH